MCVGGGHCNVQVLKHLKSSMPKSVKLTLVTDAAVALYSGMLPGAVCKFYDEDDLTIKLQPLASWCRAEYVHKKVTQIIGN